MAPFFGGIEPIPELTYKMHVIPKSDDNCSALLSPSRLLVEVSIYHILEGTSNQGNNRICFFFSIQPANQPGL